jgi:hypothetical protein
MHLVRVVAPRFRAAVVGFSALFALAGCSSSTEPHSNITPDGFAVSLTLDTTSPLLGDWVTTTMTIENTTSTELSRTFPPGDWGPLPRSSNSNLYENGFDGGFFGQFIEADQPHTLTVGAHQTVTHVFHFQAMHAGTAYISACFPDSDADTHPASCVTKSVTVTQT